ncbi:MAG TPA: S1C family serine protease, partial [bacterium]|nr:S1C family serine protease [bacterium]
LKYKEDYPWAYYNLGTCYKILNSDLVALDYYYRAGISFLEKDNRINALDCLKSMNDIDKNSILSEKLFQLIYSKSNKNNNENKPIKTSGSGFIVSKLGLIATNYHVIENIQEIKVVFTNDNNKQYLAKVVLKDKKNDIAIIKVENFNYRDIYSDNPIPYKISSANNIKMGAKVFTIGYPLKSILGEKPKVSEGIINSLYGIQDDPRLLQISVPIQSGNSGGPLFLETGEISGIVLSTLNAKFFYENTNIIPQNVNFAIKSEFLRNILMLFPETNEILETYSVSSNLKLEERIEKIIPYVVLISSY